MICACGVQFSVDHTMVCQGGGFIIQRHSELRDLEAEMLRMVCNYVEVGPVLQEVTGETLNHGVNKVPDVRFDIHTRGFWERQICILRRSGVSPLSLTETWLLSKCTRNMSTRRRGSMRKESWRSSRERSHPYILVFTSTGGVADECVVYHSTLTELIANKKGENY